MITIEPPSLGEGTAKQQLEALRGYLYRTAQQLTWAFSVLQSQEESEAGSAPTAAPRPQAPDSSPQQVFSNIKQLIIKSADIVKAYGDVIEKRLEGSYVASSQFGSFREETSQLINANSRGLSQLFQLSQQLDAEVNALQEKNQSVSAYLKSGLLQEGERPVYGLEIGQRNLVDGKPVFDRFARFTADRLSFFDSSDVEVAYISDYRLYITNAQVSGTLELAGRFRIFYQNGLTVQWTGGRA